MSTAMIPKDPEQVNTDPEEAQALALIEHAPAMVVREARLAAEALRDVIARKPRKVILNGRQYLEFEDWQLLGRFYGITGGEEQEPEFVQIGAAQGFKATAVAYDRTGRVISRATAYCLNDEPKWDTRPKYEWHYVLRNGSTSADDPGPDQIVWIPNPKKAGKTMPERRRILAGEEAVPMFQLASMAQTRANAKVLGNVLRWVAVLAGFATTPAEEVEAQADVIETTAEVMDQPDESPKADSPKAKAAPPVEAGPPKEKPGSVAIPDCPKCGTARTVIRSKFKGPAFYCYPAKGGCGGRWNDEADFEAAHG